MQNPNEEINMDMLDFLTTILERISKLQKLYRIQQNSTLDETQKLALKELLDKTAADIVAKQNVLRRFIAAGRGRPGDNQVVSQDRDEILSQTIKWNNKTQRRPSSPPSVAGKEVVCYQPREQDAMPPTLMKFDPSRAKARRNQGSIVSSRNSMVSAWVQRSSRRSTTSSSMSSSMSSSISSSISVASSSTISNNYSVSSTEDHRKYQRSRGSSMSSYSSSSMGSLKSANYSVLSTRSEESSISVASSSTISNNYSVSSTVDHRKYQRSRGSSTSSYSTSSTGSLTSSAHYSMSSTRSEESDAPPQRTDRQHKYRSTSWNRRPQTHYSCSTRSSTCSSNSSLEDEYPSRRRSRFSEVHPQQKNMGRFRRVRKNLASMFHHNHRDDSDASPSKEKSKPSSSGIRRLERAVTDKRRVTADWVERHAVVCTLSWLGRALPNNRGEARL